MEITVREALNQAMREEMRRDENVFLIGEEVAQYNGAYKVSQGLLDEFGEKRVIDTPITEEGFTGLGIGAAMAGLRPIVEWMTLNFSLMAIDQVINNAAKTRYMSGGQFKFPMVLRGPNGPAEFLAAQHSQSFQSFYAHIPGLKVCAPSNAYDAKGLLKSAIRDDNPVIFLEAELMYSWKGDVPEEEYTVPLGEAAVRNQGKDITIAGFSKPMRDILEAAGQLEKRGISCEVLDLRTIKPLDEETLFDSVKKTNRIVVVDEAWPFASTGSHICYTVSSACFDYLDAPPGLVALEDVPMPYNRRLEKNVCVSAEKIIRAAEKVLYL